MKHITLTCPSCVTPDKAVGDPDEGNHGWDGKWYCFACHTSGVYTVDFRIDKAADPEP